jgi:hypothetical protein
MNCIKSLSGCFPMKKAGKLILTIIMFNLMLNVVSPQLIIAHI